MPELSIIFANWNAADYLYDCIRSIYENTNRVSFEIIVVDNASSVGDVDTLNEAFKNVTLVKSAENLGFARANNLGFKYSTGELVLFLNPDTKLIGPAIDTLVDEIMKRPAAGIVGGRHVNPDLTVQTTSIQKFPTLMNQMLNIECLRRRWPWFNLWDIAPLFASSREPVQVEVIPGACMLLRREVFERVGGFSEDYFMYAEDIDLNLKVAKLGLNNYYAPEATIIHYGGRSSSQQKVNQWATIMKFRAMSQFYVKNHGSYRAGVYRVSMAACALIRVGLIALGYPLVRRKAVLRTALYKWTAVLKWACGLDQQIVDAACVSRPRVK